MKTLWTIGAVFLLLIAKTKADDAQFAHVVYDSLVHGLESMKVDGGQCYTVKDLMIQKDAATFLLDGTICFTQPLFGRSYAAVFKGKGRITMIPPTTIEKQQLARFNKSETLDQDIDRAVFFFCDSTNLELIDGAEHLGGDIDPNLQSTLEDALQYVVSEDFVRTPWTLYSAILNSSHSDYFMAYLGGTEKVSDQLYIIDPEETEQVRLMRTSGFSHSTRSLELICSFFRQQDYAGPIDWSIDHQPFAIPSYTIDVSIASNLNVATRISMKVRTFQGGRRWMVLSLNRLIEIQSVSIGGKELSFYKADAKVFIHLDKPSIADTTFDLTLSYIGTFITRRADAVTWEISPTRWYPWFNLYAKAAFSLTFHVPTSLSLICTAHKVSEKEANDSLTTSWSTDGLSTGCTFEVGVLDRLNPENSDCSGIHMFIEHGLRGYSSLSDHFCSAYHYFNSLIGPLDFKDITAILASIGTSNSWGGLFRLTPFLLSTPYTRAQPDVILAATCAREWWRSLDICNYHDMWLVNSLARFSALLYIQSSNKNSTSMFTELDHYRDEIINNRKSVFGEGIEASPIWLGSRVYSSLQNQGDATVVLHYKGAWIFHMLRNLMMDTKTFSDSSFFSMLQDFQTTWRHKNPTTADFQRMVEKHIGTGVDWFFTEWVYGSSVPHYTVAWKKEKDASGHYIVQLRVKQEKVAPEFSMVVPVRIGFGKNGSALVRVQVTGAQSTITLPPLGDEPDTIEFSPYDSVLATIDTEKW